MSCDLSTFDVRKVITIQRLFHRVLLSRAAKEYPDIATVIAVGTTFENMINLVKEAEVITRTKKLLQRIFEWRRDVNFQALHHDARRFLTVYLIQYFSVNMFETVNEPVVQNVMTCAREMLEHFNQLLAQLKASDKNAKCVEFRAVFQRYTLAFMVWHKFDLDRRLQRFKNTLFLLSRTQAEIPSEGLNGHMWNMLEAQANQILDRMSKDPNMASERETLMAYRRILFGDGKLGGPVIPPIPANPYLPVNQANPVNGGGAPGGQQ